MSSHYGNYLTVVSPNQQNSPYAVPRFETGKQNRSRSFSQNTNSPSTGSSSGYMQVKAVPVSPIPPRNKRASAPSITPLLSLSHPVSPSPRRRSFTSPHVIPPRILDPSSEDFKSLPFGNGGRQTVIGLPSEYPGTSMHNRDGSLASSFASSEASSLLMEELEDFELLFGDELHGTKVYDDTFSRNPIQSPLKCDISKPPMITDTRARAVSDTTMDSTSSASPPRILPPKTLKRDSSTSACSMNSVNSLSSRSSRSRRQRNRAMSDTDFAKITNEFSSLTMQ